MEKFVDVELSYKKHYLNKRIEELKNKIDELTKDLQITIKDLSYLQCPYEDRHEKKNGRYFKCFFCDFIWIDIA